jgi:hypothetical protein
MIELMTAFRAIENFSDKNENQEFIDNNIFTYFIKKIPTSWIIAAFLISFGSSYLAYQCSCNENPATRALYTIFAFFFSGFYLIYYLVVHVILGYQCFDGKNISNIIKNKK